MKVCCENILFQASYNFEDKYYDMNIQWQFN